MFTVPLADSCRSLVGSGNSCILRSVACGATLSVRHPAATLLRFGFSDRRLLDVEDNLRSLSYTSSGRLDVNRVRTRRRILHRRRRTAPTKERADHDQADQHDQPRSATNEAEPDKSAGQNSKPPARNLLRIQSCLRSAVVGKGHVRGSWRSVYRELRLVEAARHIRGQPGAGKLDRRIESEVRSQSHIRADLRPWCAEESQHVILRR